MKKNILINFRGGIGDFILFTPVLKNITRDNKYNLFFLGDKAIQQLVDGYDYFKRTIFVDYKGNIFSKLIAFIKLFLKIRNLKIHICITPICSCGKFSYLVTKLSMAEIRIGFEHKKTKGIYTHTIKINDRERDIEQNVKTLNILDIKCVTKDTELTVREYSFKMVKDYFLKQHINLNKIIIAVAPLAKGMKGYSSKEWSLDKYIKLIEKILKRFDVNIILMGTKNELHKLEKVKDSFSSNRVLLQDKSFSIYEAAAILKKCVLLICNDGGIMHTASAINIPIISIWGPTSPNWHGYLDKDNFFAIRKNNCSPCREYKRPPVKCKNQKCLKEISVDEVLKISERFLN